MSIETVAEPVTATNSTTPSDDLGIDRAFLINMARVPVIACLWFAAAWLMSLAVDRFGWQLVAESRLINWGPLAVIAFGMLLAAFIDGYAFKVPNWCTLSLVVSGWYIGAMHSCGYNFPGIVGGGGILAALGGTALGFVLLFPALFIGGMGQGDVKMTMGFGSWICAYLRFVNGGWTVWWAFAIGVLVGGVFGLVMMLIRRQYYFNKSNFQAIMMDMTVMMYGGVSKGMARAQSRRSSWVRLPYGVPLCVGFIGYLGYLFWSAN